MAELAAHSLHDRETMGSNPAGSKSDHSKRHLVLWLKTTVSWVDVSHGSWVTIPKVFGLYVYNDQ